ncbi:MAG: hypothetical protein MK089_08455 [Phycisphaerales bacterium]|nr:hypothetical protein [Phycisphaerales bacterium]
MLSFFGPESARRIGTHVSVVFAAMSTWMLIGFLHLIFPHVSMHADIPVQIFVLGCLAIYVLTPYSYSSSNAKNNGMSGRAVGLFCTELYLYLMTLWMLGEGEWLWIPAAVSVVIVLASSIFGMQVILFSAPIIAIILGEVMFIVAPALGLLLFLLTFRGYAVRYLAGQYHHKRFYSRYLADRFILKARPSIWGDLACEFWRLAFKGFKRTAYGTSAIRYIYTNPVVILLIGIPAVSVFLIFMIGDASGFLSEPMLESDSLLIIAAPVLAMLVLFLGTSFRVTRFLGEPERYVEASNGLMAIVVTLLLLPHPVLFLVFLSFSLIYLLLQLLAYARILHVRRNSESTRRISLVRGRLHELAAGHAEPPGVLCNDTNIGKSLMDVRVRVFWGITMSDVMAGLPFPEIFEQMPIINPPAVAPLARAFGAEYLVIDVKRMPRYQEDLAEGNLEFKQLYESDGLLLCSICQQDDVTSS